MSDLALRRKTLRTQFSDRSAIDIGVLRGDLTLRSGLDNIAQAIQNRLLTRKGEISKLGHEDYGSELYRLIGQPKTWKAKARAEMYIRAALKNEKRIEQILDIQFPELNDDESRYSLNIIILVKVVNYQEELKVSLSLNLAS